MSDITRRTAGVPLGAYSDYRPGQRVMTCDEIPGRVISVQEGPASNRIEVVLDNGMGGGIYDDSMLRPLNERSSSVSRTATDDYPELGGILDERPDLAPVVTESEYLGGRRTASRKVADYYLDTPGSLSLSEAASTLLSASNAAMHRVFSPAEEVPAHLAGAVVSAAQVHCATCGEDYFIDSEAEKHDHSKQADYHLFLPPRDDEQAEGKSPAYADGRAQAQAGGAREPKSPGDAAYMADFDMGWAHGVQTRPNQPELPTTDPSDLVDDTLDPDKVASRREGGIIDFIKGDSTPSPTWEGPGHNYSFDWCRFRKNSRCMFPKEMNKPATELAGYAVWIPEDRGYCPRVSWDDQKQCPVGEPGPNVPGGYTDATVPWEDGGQRGGHPQQPYHAAAKPEMKTAANNPVLAEHVAVANDSSWAFHFFATWDQVRAKAKRIRQGGGVRVLSSQSGDMVAQVKGDHHVYQTRVSTVPERYVVGSWECGCPWAAYSWGRTGPWKKFEGRMCSHALACVYEAQSRGMFGKDIHEDAVAPAWVPRDSDVKVPGDWDRDLGAYTSSVLPESWELVALMVASGRPIAELETTVLAMAVDSGHLVASAAGPLTGQVGGQVRDLILDGGEVVDAASGTPVPGPVLYPSYDPVAGLTIEAKRASGPMDSAFALTLPTREAAGTDMVAAARALMELSRRAEPPVTALLTSLARKNSGHLEWLDKRFKPEASLVRKMTAEAHEFGGDAGRTAANMSDSLRYTMVANPDHYVRTVKDTLAGLSSAGYLLRVKNYWERNDPYQGINVAVLTPEGHPFELQFHTPESMRVKANIHGLYERFRTSELERERKALYDKMTDKANKIDVPGGVELIQSLKRQDYRPLSAAAAADNYRYLQLHTVISGTPTTVLREYLGDDDYRVEIWRDGAWVRDNEYASHTLLGEGTRTDEITKAQADAAIAAMRPTATLKEAPMGAEHWAMTFGAAEWPQPHTATRVPGWCESCHKIKQVRLQRGFDPAKGQNQTGICSDCEDKAKRPGPRTSALADSFALSIGDLHEEPEAALPTTDGSDEEMERARTALLASAAISSETCPSCGLSVSLLRQDPDHCPQCGARMPSDEEDGDTGHTAAAGDYHQNVVIAEVAGRRYTHPDQMRARLTVLTRPRNPRPAEPGEIEALQAELAKHQDGLTGHTGAAQEDVVSAWHERQQRMALGMPVEAEKDPHAWLAGGSGGGDSDVASMAQAFLANRKEALKDFSAAERKSIIDEGEGVVAGNLDGLDLTGTHYQMLEQAHAARSTNDSIY